MHKFGKFVTDCVDNVVTNKQRGGQATMNAYRDNIESWTPQPYGWMFHNGRNHFTVRTASGQILPDIWEEDPITDKSAELWFDAAEKVIG